VDLNLKKSLQSAGRSGKQRGASRLAVEAADEQEGHFQIAVRAKGERKSID
jgi:hypothetical protein